MKVVINTNRYKRKTRVLGASVTLSTFALANHQATLENRTVSEIGDALWRKYLRNKRTTLGAV